MGDNDEKYSKIFKNRRGRKTKPLKSLKKMKFSENSQRVFGWYWDYQQAKSVMFWGTREGEYIYTDSGQRRRVGEKYLSFKVLP